MKNFCSNIWKINPNLPTVKIIMYLGKSYTIAKRNVWALFRNKQKIQIYKLYASYAHDVDVKK